jgi:hypothetical protein
MKFKRRLRFSSRTCFLAIGLAVICFAPVAPAQVSPSEILNPDLKALEESYFQQLKTLNQSVARTKFPFPFYLSRYVGLDPAQQAAADSRGLEFVRFQNRVILKVTGNHNAAYDTVRLTQNERAASTFRTVVLPILELLTGALPQDMACDGIGFEVSHHTRTRDRSYDYEGKEILVVVVERDDAWALAPFNVQALARSVPAKPDATSTARSSTLAGRSSLLKSNRSQPSVSLVVPAPAADPAPANTNPVLPSLKAVDPSPASAPPAPADADRLNEKHRAQLAALAKEGAARFHFVDYAPPTFMVFRNKIALQMTLRNSIEFGPVKGSIYKRAAQSFDLFLAPQLKDLSDRISPDVEFQLFDFSVLNKLSPGAKATSEAIEFICPRSALEQFVNADITNQQLLDQSVVLVNGVRVALNLQLVE